MFFFGFALLVHLLRILFKCCCRREDDDAADRAASSVKDYFWSALICITLIVGLGVFSLYLELYRELHIESEMSRAETGIWGVLGLAIGVVVFVELLIFMACRLGTLLNRIKDPSQHDPDSDSELESAKTSSSQKDLDSLISNVYTPRNQ